MQTARRFLVLTPVAIGVTAVAYLIYVVVGQGGSIEPRLVGAAVLGGLVGAAAVLAAVLIAVGLLRLWSVSNAWAALGLAFGVAAVIMGIHYASVANDDWGMLGFVVIAGAQVPTWLTFAVGLLVEDLRGRATRPEPVP